MFLIAGMIAFTALQAQANEELNLKKVNKVIKSVIQPALTPVITKAEIKFNEKSVVTSLEKMTVAASASATAKKSAWSKLPTTVDAGAQIKTVNTDPQATKIQGILSIGSKTDAVKLYAFIAKKMAESNQEPGDEFAAEMLKLCNEAAQTTKLSQIGPQLEKLVELIKKALSSDQNQNSYDKLLESLVVVSNSREVVLKTSVAVLSDDLVVNELALTITEGNLSFRGDIASTFDTAQAEEFRAGVVEYLLYVQSATAQVKAELGDLAKGYINMAESIISGDVE